MIREDEKRRGVAGLFPVHRWNNPSVTLLVTAGIYGVFILFRLAVHGFDPSVFIVAGDRFVKGAPVNRQIAVLTNSPGYDGQFYYRLALFPFPSKRTDFVISLDKPSTRHQRILYPFLVWLFTFGKSDHVPVMMIFVNFCGLCLIGWFGGVYSRLINRHALWGLIFPLFPGFPLILARDLTEIVETAMVMGCLVFVRKHKQIGAALFLTLAALAKETALFVAAGCLLSYFLARIKNEKGYQEIKWYLFAIPLFVYCVWQGILFLHWGKFPVIHRGGQAGIPFLGLGQFIYANISFATGTQGFFMLEFIGIALFTLFVIISLNSSSAWAHEKCAWVIYGLLMIMLSNKIWVEDWAFLRALVDFHVLGSFIILTSCSRVNILALLGTFVGWMTVAASAVIRI